MAARYSTKNIAPLGNRSIFVDANVILYVFWTTGESWQSTVYSKVLKKLLKNGNELVLDFIVISEVINRALRIAYHDYCQENAHIPFKEYRNTNDGKSATTGIYLILKEDILPKFNIVEKSFSKTEILSFLTEEALDFSDKGILLTCQANDYILLTNDGDFKAAEVEILTSNNAILKN